MSGTFDASLVTVVVGTRYLTGFDEGDMVSWSKDEDNFDTKIDAQGFTSVAVRNNTLGTINIPLSQESPDLQYMKQLANSNTEFPIWVTSPKEKVGGATARIKKTPDGTLGDEINGREFEIQVFDFTDE